MHCLRPTYWEVEGGQRRGLRLATGSGVQPGLAATGPTGLLGTVWIHAEGDAAVAAIVPLKLTIPATAQSPAPRPAPAYPLRAAHWFADLDSRVRWPPASPVWESQNPRPESMPAEHLLPGSESWRPRPGGRTVGRSELGRPMPQPRTRTAYHPSELQETRAFVGHSRSQPSPPTNARVPTLARDHGGMRSATRRRAIDTSSRRHGQRRP